LYQLKSEAVIYQAKYEYRGESRKSVRSAQFGRFNLAQLKKQLGSLDVFAVAAGAMISSGLFVLPAIAYAKAGPAVILYYLIFLHHS